MKLSVRNALYLLAFAINAPSVLASEIILKICPSQTYLVTPADKELDSFTAIRANLENLDFDNNQIDILPLFDEATKKMIAPLVSAETIKYTPFQYYAALIEGETPYFLQFFSGVFKE